MFFLLNKIQTLIKTKQNRKWKIPHMFIERRAFPTHVYRETMFQLIGESEIKSKTVISWGSRKEKEHIFVTFILSEGNFCSIFVLSQYMVYWKKLSHNFIRLFICF